MKKQLIISSVVAVLGILTIAVSRNNIDGSSDTALVGASIDENSKLSVVESTYDFGSVSMAKGVVTHDFIITNNSEEAVDIGEIWTSCMCTEAFLKVGNSEAGPFGMPGHGAMKSANIQVQPGEKFTLRAQFDPAAHGPAGVGPIKRDVYLKAGNNEKVAVSFMATVTP